MRHPRHFALRRCVEDVTNEEIPLRVPQGEKRRPIRFRNFTHHASTIRNFTHQGKGFVVSPTKQAFVRSHTPFRKITHHLS